MNDNLTVGAFRGLILLVCSANVCRSPLAAITMTGEARRADSRLRFASAGIDARDGAAMCHSAARGLPDEPAAHAARSLDRPLASSADLILTMEKEQRGQVARVAPGTQSRTFTLSEAVALLDLLHSRVADGSQTRLETLSEVAGALHALRGQLPLSAPSRRRKELHSTTGAWMTISDGHNQSTSAHAATIAAVRTASIRVVELLTGVIVSAPAVQSELEKKETRHAAA